MGEKRTKPELYEEIRQLKRKLRRAEAAAAKNNVFAPHVLKSIEVDADEKIFRVNGEDFGAGCTGFTISCHDYESFDIRMEIENAVRFITIRDGECVSDVEHPMGYSWYSDRERQRSVRQNPPQMTEDENTPQLSLGRQEEQEVNPNAQIPQNDD